jgi:hypothetical protein
MWQGDLYSNTQVLEKKLGAQMGINSSEAMRFLEAASSYVLMKGNKKVGVNERLMMIA